MNKSLYNIIGIKNSFYFLMAIVLLFGFFSLPVHSASPVAKSLSFNDYQEQEKSRLLVNIEALKQEKLPKNEEEFNEKMHRVTALLTLTEAKIETLKGFWDTKNKLQVDHSQRLKYLKQLPLVGNDQSIEERVAVTQTLLTNNEKTLGTINENLELSRQFQMVLRDQVKKLEQWKVNFKLEEKLTTISNTRVKLKKDLKTLYEQNNSEPKTKKIKNTETQLELESKTLINNQQVALIQSELDALALQKKVVRANILLLKNSDTKTLQSVIEIYQEIINKYSKIIDSLQQMALVLKTESVIQLDPNFKNSVNSLQNTIKERIKSIKEKKQILVAGLADYKGQLKKLTSIRQGLSDYRVATWLNIVNKIIAIPNLFYNYVKLLTLKAYDSYRWLDLSHASLFWGLLGFVVIVFILVNRFLKSMRSDKERSSLTGYLYDGILVIVQKNIVSLCLFSLILTVFYFLNISFSNYELFFNLFMIWFTVKALLLTSRLILLERITDSTGKDVKLYYRLKWLLLFGGWATALMMLGHLLPLSLILQDIFNRLFMLFLLTVSLVAWKSKEVIPELINPLLQSKKRYIQNAISLLVILIPITLFSTAIIGLFGFVDLAWVMSRYQAYFLMVLIGYILARGLLFDALEAFSGWMITSLNNGWLWIEVFLKPLDKIMRIVLIVISVAFLFGLYGWYSNSTIMLNLKKIAQYSLVNITGIHITVESAIEFFFLVAVFIWMAKWTREFCFRWLYRNAKDPGVRNSLSVFTQYAVVLLGTYITLFVLGLDITGMSMILGGLAVGMGFGLKDFANNIMGGIMLLIERPVREGDLITLGEYEGQVSHIGIRSMRVSTWDNTEVLIPNAETFNKPFTNWTHQDGIVRTVIPIKVSRADDPVIIQQLILDVLAIIPEIVPDPPVQAYLKKIDDALIEFEVRYFINVHLHTRYEVRSKVLFAITAQFKAAGIRPPVDPITIQFKEGHDEFLSYKTNS